MRKCLFEVTPVIIITRNFPFSCVCSTEGNLWYFLMNLKYSCLSHLLEDPFVRVQSFFNVAYQPLTHLKLTGLFYDDF